MPAREDTERIQFWRNGLKACVRRGGAMRCEREVENCRLNGDAYGEERDSCLGCGWATSFLFDDASTPYYFETGSWE